jgi:hypothetical protein
MQTTVNPSPNPWLYVCYLASGIFALFYTVLRHFYFVKPMNDVFITIASYALFIYLFVVVTRRTNQTFKSVTDRLSQQVQARICAIKNAIANAVYKCLRIN